MAKKKEIADEPLEKQLWKAADKLRKNIDAAEYKHVVLGLIFLRYISVSFEDLYNKLKQEIDLGADPEDREEYKAENVFYVPVEARWSTLVASAKDPRIGKLIDGAMDAIEKDNPSLKGVLPKVFARPNLDPTSLGELIDLIGNSTLNASTNSADLLGHVFEYFLGEFALAEGKKGTACQYAGTLQRPCARPLLWFRRYVCAEREVCGTASGTCERYIYFRTGKQSDHLATL